MPAFTTTRRVEFADTDMAGIVHFANFFRYMEQAEHEFLRSVGLSVAMDQPDGSVIGWPRVSCSCSFDEPARFEDVLEIRVSVSRIGGKSVTYEIEFFRAGTRIASGRAKAACCRFGHGQPMASIEIPGDVRERLERGNE
ncbi:MAG TPA: thioesterase family protein [Planctomycetaceae bacterium]|nr:thioesterase family protein [Planctomycetaceae bacterium]